MDILTREQLLRPAAGIESFLALVPQGDGCEPVEYLVTKLQERADILSILLTPRLYRGTIGTSLQAHLLYNERYGQVMGPEKGFAILESLGFIRDEYITGTDYLVALYPMYEKIVQMYEMDHEEDLIAEYESRAAGKTEKNLAVLAGKMALDGQIDAAGTLTFRSDTTALKTSLDDVTAREMPALFDEPELALAEYFYGRITDHPEDRVVMGKRLSDQAFLREQVAKPAGIKLYKQYRINHICRILAEQGEDDVLVKLADRKTRKRMKLYELQNLLILHPEWDVIDILRGREVLYAAAPA